MSAAIAQAAAAAGGFVAGELLPTLAALAAAAAREPLGWCALALACAAWARLSRA